MKDEYHVIKENFFCTILFLISVPPQSNARLSWQVKPQTGLNLFPQGPSLHLTDGDEPSCAMCWKEH